MSKIEWTDETWNPTRGCSRVSRGCEHCYAERMAGRFSDVGQPFHGFAVTSPEGHGARWTGKVELIPEKLEEPLHWKKPRRVFVNSMSDLFHEKLPSLDIARVLNIIGGAPKHTFQVLTKRPGQMKATMEAYYAIIGGERPFRNLWLGVSVEDQKTADERIPLLLETPAAHRFVSYEPALGPVDLNTACAKTTLGRIFSHGLPDVERYKTLLGWVIYGGESGPGARPNDLAWARSARDQCREAGVPFFCKQLGGRPFEERAMGPPEAEAMAKRMGLSPCVAEITEYRLRNRKGSDPSEWPEDLRVRELPGQRRLGLELK